MIDWISIKDRLPERGRIVLMFKKGMKPKKVRVFLSPFWNYMLDNESFSHWAEINLPEKKILP